MTDTVTRLMSRAHTIENLSALAADPMNSEADQTEYVKDLVAARKSLKAELTRLFAPLSDEQILEKWMDGRVPVLNFAREIEACHGIGCES